MMLFSSCVHYLTKQETNQDKSTQKYLPVINKETFWTDVAPIIQKKCVSCHYPQGDAPIDLSSYKKIASRHAMIKYVIENNLMPPYSVHSNIVSLKDDISLTPYEKSVLIKWISTGLKKQKDFFLVKKKNRNIKHPDYSIKLPKPKIIKATGFMSYHTFTAQTNFLEDKWIKEIEYIIKPKVIHHITFQIFNHQLPIDYQKSKICKKLNLKHVACAKTSYSWGIGKKKHIDFKKNGIKVLRKSKITVQIHYQPIGQEVLDDMTEIRFLFHKKNPKNQIINLRVYDTSVKIPPGEPNYKSEMSYPVKENLLFTGATVHMHLRGKASTISVITEKNKKTIINVDPYRFYFQRDYWFKDPIKIKKNSVIKCTNWFDNSSKNIINPNPKQTVFWGHQTTDEMPICGFILLVPFLKNFNI